MIFEIDLTNQNREKNPDYSIKCLSARTQWKNGRLPRIQTVHLFFHLLLMAVKSRNAFK